ncbi:MAG: c-type cytochrome [Gammaproteobacteria bacterium]|nr:c-type cytochrome [Gammaproteobacteria bacterium]
MSCTKSMIICFMMLLFSISSPGVASTIEQARKEAELAISLTPDLKNGKELYRICAVCHTPEGWGTASGYYPQIAGQLSSVVIKQLADIRARNRDNPTMYPFSMPSSLGGAQEMADVAAYVANLPMTPFNSVGPGFDLAYGEEMYRKECAECHGERGEGDNKDHIPLVQGQHYDYLVRQFRWIQIGKRRNADPEMVDQIKRYSPHDIRIVMDYISRLKPAPEKLADKQWRNPDFPEFARHTMPPIMRHAPSMQPPPKGSRTVH